MKEIVNDNEMRGFFYTEYGTPVEYREHLMRRLRGEVDTEYNPKPNGPENWLARFRLAFDAPQAAPDEIITMTNVQRALAAYIRSQVFVDTPWRAFLGGDLGAISDEAKRGALLFFRPLDDGGLGCAACHFVPDIARSEQKDLNRSPLVGVADRYSPADLVTFLGNPHGRYPDGRMPRLPVTNDQARDITAYLMLWSKPSELPAVEPPTPA